MPMKRWFLLFAMFLFAGLSELSLPGNGYAAGQSRAGAGSPSASIRGTWRSTKEALTFNADGTAIYRGRRYYYAVSSGGTIQLTGKHGSVTLPYQLAGGKLTLTVDGKPTVYTRRR